MKRIILLFLCVLVLAPSGRALALSAEQRKVLDSGVRYFDVEVASSTGGCGSGSLIGNDNAEKAFHFFVSKGYEAFQSAGIVGNMMLESGVQPQRLQGTASGVITPASEVGNTSLGWGIVQWTPGSKMIEPVTAEGKDPNDLAIQLEFLWNQLEGNGPKPEKRAGDELKATTTVEEAVLAFQGNMQAGGQYYGFERPKDQTGSVDDRTTYAKDVLAQYGSGVAVAGGGCQLDASGCPTGPISVSETVVVQEIRVHPCISAEVERIIILANQQGLNMSGGGYRDSAGQIETRKSNCGTSQYDIYEKPAGQCSPPTARPGTSRHERGTAVDFTCDGSTFSSRSHPCYQFLDENTQLKNLPSEAWHWSIDGN